MKIKEILSTTDGLASAYQRTSNTDAGVSVAVTTGGDILIGKGVPVCEDVATEGYQAMNEENVSLAEEMILAVSESWPVYKEL